jgi:hypothetical protein
MRPIPKPQPHKAPPASSSRGEDGKTQGNFGVLPPLGKTPSSEGREITMLHRTYDHWKTTNPADEHLGLAPEDEDELPEPTVEEVWDGGRGEYIFEVTFENGSKFTILQEREGAYTGDYSIHGKDYYADGFVSPEKAIERLFDMALNP